MTTHMKGRLPFSIQILHVRRIFVLMRAHNKREEEEAESKVGDEVWSVCGRGARLLQRFVWLWRPKLSWYWAPRLRCPSSSTSIIIAAPPLPCAWDAHRDFTATRWAAKAQRRRRRETGMDCSGGSGRARCVWLSGTTIPHPPSRRFIRASMGPGLWIPSTFARWVLSRIRCLAKEFTIPVPFSLFDLIVVDTTRVWLEGISNFKAVIVRGCIYLGYIWPLLNVNFFHREEIMHIIRGICQPILGPYDIF